MNQKISNKVLIFIMAILLVSVVTSFDGSELDDICAKNNNILFRTLGKWGCAQMTDFINYQDIILNVTGNITQSSLTYESMTVKNLSVVGDILNVSVVNYNVTGNITLSGDLSSDTITTNGIYGGVGFLNTSADPWDLSGVDLDLNSNVEINGNLDIYTGDLNVSGDGYFGGNLIVISTFPELKLIDSDATSYNSYGWFRAWNNPGLESGFDIDAMTDENDDTSYFRFFRYVNTTNPALIRIMTGEATNTPNIQMAGKGLDTYFNALNSNFIIGDTDSIDNNKLTVVGNSIINGNLTIGGTMTGDVAWKISPNLVQESWIIETNFTANTTEMRMQYTSNVSGTDYDATTVYDSSGYSNDMTISNAIINSDNGVILDGIGCNGYNSIVKIQNPSYIPRDNLEDYSISAWLQYNQVVNAAVPLGYVSSISGVEVQSYIISFSGKMRWAIRADDGSSYNVYGGENIPTGEWIFVTLTKSGQDYKLYRNGEIDGNGTFDMSGETFTNRNYFTVCASYDNFVNTNWYNGSVDEIRVWNRSLTEAEIKLMYNENMTIEYNQYDLSFFWNNTERIRFSTNGTEYSGDIYAYDFLSLSDERTKENLKDYEPILTFPKPKSFTYVNDDEIRYSISAQDLPPEIVKIDSNGNLRPSINGQIAMLQAEIINLNERIKKLENAK